MHRVIWILVIIIILLILLIPIRWNGCPPPLPPYRLCDVIHNEYLKKKHQWFRVPLNIAVCLDNLAVFKRIMHKVGIRDDHQEWWLSEGTALGCFRDKQLLAWDDDVDVYVEGSKLDVFFDRAWPKLKRAGFHHVHSHPYYYVSLVRNGEKLDVGFLIDSPDHKTMCGAGHVPCSKLRPLIFPTIPIQLGSATYYVPGNVGYYEMLYGKDWYVPQFNVSADKGDQHTT